MMIDGIRGRIMAAMIVPSVATTTVMITTMMTVAVMIIMMTKAQCTDVCI
jgi:hypothetical protein